MPALVTMDSTVCFLSNLIPVYVDINPETLLIDERLTKKNIPKKCCCNYCSLYGNVPEMDKIKYIYDQNDLHLIEDNVTIFASKEINKLAIGVRLQVGLLKIQNIFPLGKEEWSLRIVKDWRKNKKSRWARI